jgi:hypothetical protein
MKHITASLLTLLSLVLCAQAETYIFDFGTKDSPLHRGAIRVTEAGGDRANWKVDTQRRASANAIRREWTEDKSSGRKNPPPCFQTELTCDHVSSDRPDSLTLDVPAGAYKLVLLCGRAGERAQRVWDTGVSTGGSSASATFAGGHELRALYLDAVADANGLSLAFTTRSRWLVNALIAVPAAEWVSARKRELEPLLAECLILPRAELAKWKETPRPSTTPEPIWTDKQKQDRLAVYTRPWAEPVWPDHFPRQHELDAPVRAFASWNEYEPLTFTLYPLSGFSNVSVAVYGDLVNTAGVKRAAIPAAAIDLRFVRYMNVRPNYSSFNTYYRAPDVLMPWQPQPLTKGENLRLWLTVHVALGQPAGLYTGEARVTADNVTLSVPISLRVLPIALQKDQSLVYGQYYHHPLRNIDGAPDDFSRAWWQHKAEAEHADMREHGMNTVVLGLGGSWNKSRWSYDFSRLQRDIDLARSVGFDKPIVCSFPCDSLYHKYMKAGMGSHLGQVKMPPDAFFDELTAMVRAIEAEARRRQWPELLYYPVDEPSTSPDSVAFMTRVMASIKQVPKVRTYITADPEHEQFAPMRPYIDVWCCQPFSLGRAAVLADMKARGVEYWCYPNHISGENDHTTTVGARMTYGFGFWQSGYRSLIPWIYQYDCGDPWNYLDSSAQDFFNRTADDGAPIPVTLWEADREGIDDHRYVFTLENAIARAEEAGHKEAGAKARATLDQILAAISVQPKYKNDGLWSAQTFDAWRWAVAEQILALQKLMD